MIFIYINLIINYNNLNKILIIFIINLNNYKNLNFLDNNIFDFKSFIFKHFINIFLKYLNLINKY
jgi:hypothetical protein